MTFLASYNLAYVYLDYLNILLTQTGQVKIGMWSLSVVGFSYLQPDDQHTLIDAIYIFYRVMVPFSAA